MARRTKTLVAPLIWFLTLLALNLLPPSLVYAQSACKLPDGLKPLSQCLDSSRNAVVGPTGNAGCSKVVVDQDFTGANALKHITVEADGELYIRDESRQVAVEKISVAGLFQVGTQDCPIGTGSSSNQVTLTFVGERPCASPNKCDGFNKGIAVEEFGKLRLFGIKGVPKSSINPVSDQPVGVSWTHLALPAGDETKYGPTSGALAPVLKGGSNTLTLDRNVVKNHGAWQEGDWIAVATTGFSPVETEIVQIAKIDQPALGGTVLTLKQPLKHYHFGGPDPGDPSLDNFNQCSGFNYGVDERAEVALLSRNIKLDSANRTGCQQSALGRRTAFS